VSDTVINRRHVMTVGAALTAGAAIAGSGAASAATAPAPTGISYTPKPVPLPFDPKTITGLSEKLLTSHHDNNYVGAVKRLGAITGQVAALDPATAPGFALNGLKREELIAWNSMILHELYFAGLGAPTNPTEPLSQTIEHHFGSYDRWATEFSSMGKALAGGSGWVLLTWSDRDNRLVNQWAADHSMTLAGGVPILALDMYEHA
jgi:Fe-Mn family superoxide dismutase